LLIFSSSTFRLKRPSSGITAVSSDDGNDLVDKCTKLLVFLIYIVYSSKIRVQILRGEFEVAVHDVALS